MTRGDQGSLIVETTTTTTAAPATTNPPIEAETTTTTEEPMTRGDQGSLVVDSTTTTTAAPETPNTPIKTETTTTTDEPVTRGDQENLEGNETTPTVAATTTDGYSHLRGQSCFDYPSYRDPRGFACRDWADLNCATATSLGYSRFHQNEISRHCQKSCGICTTDTPAPKCSSRDSSSYGTQLTTVKNSGLAGDTCFDWAGKSCLEETTMLQFSTRQTRELLEHCPFACGLCVCEEGHDCKAEASDEGPGEPGDNVICEAIKCGALCAKEEGCGWSSDESRCVLGGFTSDDELLSGECAPMEGKCTWFVMAESNLPCACSTAACSSCKYNDFVEECLECGAGTYLEDGKCVLECQPGLIAAGLKNAQRVCTEPFSCSAGSVMGGIRTGASCTCSSECSTCRIDEAGSHCSACSDGYEIFQGVCVAKCPQNTDEIVLVKASLAPSRMCWPREYCHHGTGVGGGLFCQCPVGCEECRGSLCRSCKTGYAFLDGACVTEDSCPAHLPAMLTTLDFPVGNVAMECTPDRSL